MVHGYTGKMLFVDLSTGSFSEETLAAEMAGTFIGGYGLGAKVLYDHMPAHTDPLGPDSMMGFVTGPLTGSKALFGGRYMIVHKSPVTGGWNDANSGGFWGPELKKAGYDAVFVKGVSEKPVYLYINDGKVEIRDAQNLWGLDAKETWEALKKETGQDKVRVVCIGPAGEKLSLISCPINDGHRAPGRGGGGAVMGSKKLKAIAVHGTGTFPIADPDRVLEINRKLAEGMKDNPAAMGFGTYGTGVGTGASALSGDSPVKNWGGVGITDYGVESADKVAATTFDADYKTAKYACAFCPLGCGAEYEVNDGRWPVGPTERPEYETAAAFGSTLLCDEMDAIMKCNEICNRYGIDTISAGMTIAWAMECYNEGVLSKEELDGIDLQWGDGAAIVAIMQKMADGDGIGAVLAKGSRGAADHLGKGHEYLQVTSGIELPMHDPRFAPGLARTYQIDPTPGRHVKGGLMLAQLSAPNAEKYEYEGTGEPDARATAEMELNNAAGLCLFLSLVHPLSIQNEYLEAVTGMPFNDQEAYHAGLRVYGMRQAFNTREGIRLTDMDLSPRAIGEPPLQSGPLAGITVDRDKLLKNFLETLEMDPVTGEFSAAMKDKIGLKDQ
jgi:aldehyde:ferredoxin oxidoreductase